MLCQTTDSGSNDNTMAKTMHDQICDDKETTGFEWDYETMHIKCFCHKLALVVNAGLNKLGLKSPPPPKFKRKFLGAVPYSNTLDVIVEEEEEEEEVNVVNLEEESDQEEDVESEDVDDEGPDLDENDQSDNNGASDKEIRFNKNKSASNRTYANELNSVTKIVSYLILIYFQLD